VALRDGAIVAEGAPGAVLTPVTLEAVFGVRCDVVSHPGSGLPVSVPRGRDRGSDPPPAASGETAPPALRAERLSSGYGHNVVLQGIDVDLPAGRITAIVGPNACGKSTLLRTLARLLPVKGGEAWLGDRRVRAGTHRAFARRLGLLAQGPVAPAGVIVEDLVAAGRYPYQRWYRQWDAAGEQAIEAAIEATGLQNLRLRPVDELSGGQRQRVWVALALAQDTPVLLLDEPTTFLDIAHAVETLDLMSDLNTREGRTVVIVLHDLGQACRYADHIVAMRDGHVVAAGDPRQVVTAGLLRDVFGVESWVVADPQTGKPLVLPMGPPGPVPAPALQGMGHRSMKGACP
jgi:iron complex transport system ATP-binding protein